MADRGWVLNLGQGRWELLGADGEQVHGWITLEFLGRVSGHLLKAELAANGWPVLTPGVPWIHCVFADGPLAGRHEYLDPLSYEVAAPEQLTLAWGSPVAGLRHGREFTATYRRQIQGCGHGRTCGYPYSWDRGLW